MAFNHNKYFWGLRYPDNCLPGAFVPIHPDTDEEDMPLVCLNNGITMDTIVYPDNKGMFNSFKVGSLNIEISIIPHNPYRVVGLANVYTHSQEVWELVCTPIEDTCVISFEEDPQGNPWIWVTKNDRITLSWEANSGIDYLDWYLSYQNDDPKSIFGIYSPEEEFKIMVEFERALDKFEEEFEINSRHEFL